MQELENYVLRFICKYGNYRYVCRLGREVREDVFYVPHSLRYVEGVLTYKFKRFTKTEALLISQSDKRFINAYVEPGQVCSDVLEAININRIEKE